MDREAWYATVPRVSESDTTEWLTHKHTHTYHLVVLFHWRMLTITMWVYVWFQEQSFSCYPWIHLWTSNKTTLARRNRVSSYSFLQTPDCVFSVCSCTDGGSIQHWANYLLWHSVSFQVRVKKISELLGGLNDLMAKPLVLLPGTK